MCIILLYILLTILKITAQQAPECFEYSCSECSDNKYGACTKCKDTFPLISGTCPCADANCALCLNGLESWDNCKLCKKGGELRDGMCYCKSKNCQICGDPLCKKCNDGYALNTDTGDCDAIKDIKYECFDTNCIKCASNEQGMCEECSVGYHLKKGECIALPSPDRSLNCGDGYSLKFGFKIYCDYNCKGYNCETRSGNYYCSFSGACNEGYLCPYNPCVVCVSNSIGHLIQCDNDGYCTDNLEHCAMCITNDECTNCEAGYYLKSGRCHKCSEGCSICISGSLCNVCLSGYTNNEGICIKSDQLDFDEGEYIKARDSLLIKPAEPQEETTYKDENSQESKDENSQESKDEDKSHSESISEQKSETKEEKQPIEETSSESTTTSNNIDTTPEEENKVILKCEDPNCQICSKGTCAACKDSYTLIEGVCHLCGIKFCKTCTEGVCKECLDSYNLTSPINCTKIECTNKNCEECTAKYPLSEHCTKCKEGYEPDGYGSCKMICKDSNCQICSKSSSECEEPKLGYYLSPSKKILPCFDVNCGECKDGEYNSCKTCRYDHIQINGECGIPCQKNINHCGYCKTNKEGKYTCIKCMEGYNINDKGECSDASKVSLIAAIICAVLGVGIIVGIIIYVTRRKDQEEQVRQFRENQNNLEEEENYSERSNPYSKEGAMMTKKQMRIIYADEFDLLKKEEKRDDEHCSFCVHQRAKYKADCGCFLCKEHSKGKKNDNGTQNEEKKEEEEDAKICPCCSKVIHSLNIIKKPCGICLQERKVLSSFNCGCSLQVCKECFIRCKMDDDRCPACRKVIN